MTVLNKYTQIETSVIMLYICDFGEDQTNCSNCTTNLTPVLKAKQNWGNVTGSQNQYDHRVIFAATYYTSKGSLRNLQILSDWFRFHHQIVQDAAGKKDLLLRALQQETNGCLTSRLSCIWQNPHTGSRFLGHLKDNEPEIVSYSAKV